MEGDIRNFICPIHSILVLSQPIPTRQNLETVRLSMPLPLVVEKPRMIERSHFQKYCSLNCSLLFFAQVQWHCQCCLNHCHGVQRRPVKMNLPALRKTVLCENFLKTGDCKYDFERIMLKLAWLHPCEWGRECRPHNPSMIDKNRMPYASHRN